MVTMPLSQTPLSQASSEPETPTAGTSQPTGETAARAVRTAANDEAFNWVRIAAVGSLALSGVLIMSGRRRAGLVSAVTCTAFAMLDQQDSVKTWWQTLPVYLAEVELMLNRAQGAVDSAAAQHRKLRQIFKK